MDINSYSDSDSDENNKLPQPSAEETGVAHTDDEWDAQQARARPAPPPQNKHLNLQQRFPGLGTPVGGVEQVPTQKAAARLAGPSIGGAGGHVPEFVQRLLAEELKEWTLAQGELLGNDVQQLDYTTRLETLARLPCVNSPSFSNKRAAPPPKLPPSNHSKQPHLETSSLQDEASAAASFSTAIILGQLPPVPVCLSCGAVGAYLRCYDCEQAFFCSNDCKLAAWNLGGHWAVTPVSEEGSATSTGDSSSRAPKRQLSRDQEEAGDDAKGDPKG